MRVLSTTSPTMILEEPLIAFKQISCQRVEIRCVVLSSMVCLKVSLETPQSAEPFGGRLRPISLLTLWVSGGLTQAQSYF